MRVLLVDDEALIRWSLSQALTALGHEVTQAKCGNEALAVLQAEEFDLLLTDLKLPGVDGFKVIEAARATRPDIPVIMMSAHGNREAHERVSALQVNYFLEKPLIVEDVSGLVESLSRAGEL